MKLSVMTPFSSKKPIASTAGGGGGGGGGGDGEGAATAEEEEKEALLEKALKEEKMGRGEWVVVE